MATKTKKEFETPGHDDSRDVATLKSMIADSNEELDKKLSPTGISPAALKWRSTATLFRTIRQYNYLKEKPSDEAVGKIESTRCKTLVIKSPSTRAGEEDHYLLEAEAENEAEERDLKPLGFKYRLAASFLNVLIPFIFKKNGTVDTTILDIVDLKVKANKTTVDGIYTTDVMIDKASDVWVRIFAPSESKDRHSVVVYFHGGGFAAGSPNSSEYDKLSRLGAKILNVVLISVHYPLSPDFRFPVQYDACFKVLQWLQKTPAGSEFLPATADVSQCFLAGDSAGGNIVHHVGCRAAVADLGPVKIRGWALIQPFFGGQKRTRSEETVKNPVLLTLSLADWFWHSFLPQGADRDHKAANVFGPNAPDISRLPLPPIFMAIGTHDILKDRQRAYANEMATIIGNDNITVKQYIGGFHGFFALDHDLQTLLMLHSKAFMHRVLGQNGQND